MYGMNNAPPVTITVVNGKGVITGLDYDTSHSLALELNTEYEFQGSRIKFEPTRYTLDLLVAKLGREVFDEGCRFAWSHFYKKPAKSNKTAGEFEFVTEPYKHQKDWFDRVKDKKYFAFEWEMGLGKTKIILDICQSLWKQGEIDALLVITLKGVHWKWAELEAPLHFPASKPVAWNNTRKNNNMEINGVHITKVKGFVVAAINFDAVRTPKGKSFCERFLRTREAGIVIDESQKIKTPRSATTKACLRLSKMAEYKWICTGTMSTGKTIDAWSQYRFLNTNIFPEKFEAFKHQYCEMEDVGNKKIMTWETDPLTKRSHRVEKPLQRITGAKNLDELVARLNPFRSRLLKEECLDLPEKLYRLRSFILGNEQRKIYTDMLKNFRSNFEGQTMTAARGLTWLLRLHQITCNFVTPDDCDPLDENIKGEPITSSNPRIDALMEEISKIDGACIVWSSWRYCLREIKQALAKEYGAESVREYHGGVKDTDKKENLEAFQNGEGRFFLANPQSAGVGIDLVRAQQMIYYNNSYDLALRLQSEDRIHRIGQTGACTITDIEGIGTIDREQLKMLKQKQELSSVMAGDGLRKWLSSTI